MTAAICNETHKTAVICRQLDKQGHTIMGTPGNMDIPGNEMVNR